MLIKAFLIALLFSFFIYSEAFGVSFKLINTAFGLIALFFIIKSKTYELFWIGFFIAILWFYWIGLSFRYYDLYWMIPFVIIFIGVVYGLLFWIMGKISSFFSNFMQPFIK
ncbi:MAG TPA: apolipoprotein N-acyltransferase, partial [Campylobacterales bacterium]|nr:apolipoprotein N-acyltransferase [Campylobacterales bacterium]